MIRERKGLTRKQLAKIANISESYLEKIEKRDCGISLEKFEIIMAALEMFPMLISYSDLNIKP
jgi:transcriptional regulator with XRE-family HTH domain